VKALVKTQPGPGLELVDIPVPHVGPGDVLVNVKATGICGTDLHIECWDEWAQKTLQPPVTVGHEFSGEVVEIGSGVTDVAVGDLVSGECHLVCGRCRNCRAGRRHLCIHTRAIGVNLDGAFAEYVALPAGNIWVHRDPVDPEVAAIFDPFGNAVHTALSFDLVGEDVLVTGAGPIGIMGAMVAKRSGARKVVITDINPLRLELARKCGIDYVVDPSKEDLKDVMNSIGMKEGFDVGLEMSGAPPAFRSMIETMNNGGKIAILGIAPDGFGIDWNKVIFKMLTLKGIYGREMFETWYKMIAFVQGGLDVSQIITHRIRIDEFRDGFEAMRSGNSGKVVMDWN
jgi:threonine 3-dehydrogenase